MKPTPSNRVRSVDALRGLVMIIMALDHVRDFLSAVARKFQPDDLTQTTAAFFFTRWITHFCAPVFMFTAGLGAFFILERGRTKMQLSRFLLTRGLWLLILEFTVMRFAISFYTGPIILEVVWALGCSMIILAALVHIPIRFLAPLSVAVICLHNLTDPLRGGNLLWRIFHQGGVTTEHGILVAAGYPLIPWFAVMSAGFCFGRVMTLEASIRRRWLLRIGLIVTAAFVIVRTVNVYGDPQPWSGALDLSFLRVTKYPPSLDFLLMTLGPAILVLRWFDRMNFSDANPLIVFGRVPLFYFIVHFYLIRGIGQSIGEYRHSLPEVYAVWIAVVIVMYFPCRWFMQLKQRHRDWWLSYL